MSHLLADLSQELNKLDASPTLTNPWAGFEQFAERFRGITEYEGIAHFGANTYAGCLLIALSNALRRFKSDIAAGEAWRSAPPSFNGYSVGRIIVAAANGYRHEDEWAKAREMDDRQRRSREVITGALAAQIAPNEGTGARCVEIVQLLSQGDYEVLANNVLGFAHNVALTEQARS
jgi:hypothetical protein